MEDKMDNIDKMSYLDNTDGISGTEDRDIVKEKINLINEICNLLYRNDAEGLTKLDQEIRWVSDFVLDAASDELHFNGKELLRRLQKVIEGYKCKDVLKLADTLKYEIIDAIVYICSVRGMNLDIKDFEMPQKKDKLYVTDLCNYENNLSLIKKNTSDFYNLMKDYCDRCDMDDDAIIVDEHFNIDLRPDNGIAEDVYYYMNSKYNSENAAALWVEDITQNLNYKSIILIAGMSDGEYIKKTLSEMGDENILIVYEPEPRIYAANVMYNHISDILSDNRCFIFVEGVNTDYVHSIVNIIFGYESIQLLTMNALPVYDILYYDKIQSFIETLKKEFNAIILLNNTIIMKNEYVISNIIDNLYFAMTGSTVRRLKETVGKEIEGKEIPAILVAAGPSLDKNIKYLKDAKGKAFIIGVDSSMRMLLKNDIIPDILVTIDPDKERVLFEDPRANDIPMVYCMHSTYEIVNNNKNKKFLFSNFRYIDELFKKMDKSIGILDTGGSVANTGFSLAMYLGFQNIIMIGQDLAFTDNKKHASDVYEEKGVGEDDNAVYDTVEGMFGGELLTYKNFKVYRDWYEQKILDIKNIHVVNSTEGGALIHGAENIPLREAISQFCKDEICFDEIIQACDNEFSEAERDAFKKFIMAVPDECDELKKLFEESIGYYKNMLSGLSEEEFQKQLKQVAELTDRCDNYAIMEFISYSARLKETQARFGLYDNLENEPDARIKVASLGIEVLEEYILAEEKLKEKYMVISERIKNI